MFSAVQIVLGSRTTIRSGSLGLAQVMIEKGVKEASKSWATGSTKTSSSADRFGVYSSALSRTPFNKVCQKMVEHSGCATPAQHNGRKESSHPNGEKSVNRPLPLNDAKLSAPYPDDRMKVGRPGGG
jgi:hypothetical protein